MLRSLVAFHFRAGTRAALRSGTILVAGIIFAFGMAPDPAYTLMTFVRGIVGHDAEPVVPSWARLGLAAFALVLASLGARRVTLGATGWPRSLPVSAATARRAAWIAVSAAALPVMLFAVAIAPALMVGVYDAPSNPARLLSLPLLFGAAGAVAIGVERAPARAVAVLALVAAALGTWPALALAIAALAVWDRSAGGLAAPAVVRRRRRAPAGRRLPARASGLALAVRLAWRATGPGAAAEGWLAAAVPVGFTVAMRVNNPELSAADSVAIGRAGAALGVVICTATVAAALLARRAPWPWARALPWSAAERVLVDAGAVALPAVVTAGVAGVLHGAATLGTALASATVAAVAAAGALRVGARRQTGAWGETLVIAAPVAVAFALRPATAWLAPIIALALGALAVRRDRRAADAVRWSELRHDAVGDAGWISRA